LKVESAEMREAGFPGNGPCRRNPPLRFGERSGNQTQAGPTWSARARDRNGDSEILDFNGHIPYSRGMSHLERALHIAVEAHAGQEDKSGLPYAFHPIRVMLRCKCDEAKIAALLHDVVEDTTVSFDQLSKEGFSEEVLSAVRLLTHDPSVSYEDYIRQLSTNPIAKEVKLADLEDNSDIRRMKGVDEKAVARLRRYLFAYRYLTGASDALNA
jgi:uncharacterized protein (DUF58 family)